MITIFKRSSRTGDEKLSHEILTATLNHCSTRTHNYIKEIKNWKINARVQGPAYAIFCKHLYHLYLYIPLFLNKEHKKYYIRRKQAPQHCSLCIRIWLYVNATKNHFPHAMHINTALVTAAVHGVERQWSVLGTPSVPAYPRVDCSDIYWKSTVLGKQNTTWQVAVRGAMIQTWAFRQYGVQ
jgi:hypothetical protein